MAHKLSFAFGAAVEDQTLHKACNEKCNGKGEEYLYLGSKICNNCRKGEQAEYKQNLLTYTVIHISQAPPCYSSSCHGGGLRPREAHQQ